MRVFLAGATGAIGRRLVPLLVGAGHAVTGTTRFRDRAEKLRAAGVDPVIVDVFDAAALKRAVGAAQPEVVIHQLTDLPQQYDPKTFGTALQRTARLRMEGTSNLVAAAQVAGARRLIAQSVAFMYAPGSLPHRESDPLNVNASGDDGLVSRSLATLERLVTTTPGIEGIVLRYGHLYGPGTWTQDPFGDTPVHVDAAAYAAFLAVTQGGPGIYNVSEDLGSVSIGRARQELGWDPAFRLPTDRQAA
jgi:nucleoside-diphosphate-sugar epimerase